MAPKLYINYISPAVRATLMACEIFNVQVETIKIDIFAMEQWKPQFLKINPLHTVPVLEDGDFILHDRLYTFLCHAIIMYLADTYSKDDKWYPKDLKQRALVNQKLFFETSIIFPTVRNITRSIVVHGKKTIEQKLLDKMEKAYSNMEQFLQQTTFIAGDEITIADLSAISNIAFMVHFLPLNEEKYPKTTKWFRKMEEQPYHQKHNVSGAMELANFIKKCL